MQDQQRNRIGLGYRWNTSNGNFNAQIKDEEGSTQHLGTFDCPLLARIAYHNRLSQIASHLNPPFLPRKKILRRPYPLLNNISNI